MVFFIVGVVSIATSCLFPDLMQYYRDRQILNSLEESIDKLESLNSQYDTLLKNLEKDPNLLSRVAPAVLGTEPLDSNAVYPKATAEELSAAKKALEETSQQKSAKTEVPKWLIRLSEPRRRLALFIAGAALILLSFICFGYRPKKTNINQSSED
jgi:hypothetical protein